MYKTIVITFSLLLAIYLMLLPVPSQLVWLRPAWVLLILIYWSIAISYRNGLVTAWFTGLMIDLLTGSVLGEHAFALTLVSYGVAKFHLRLRMFPLMQQAMSVFLFVLFYQLVIYCIEGFQGEQPHTYQYWLSSVTSMAVWPLFFVLMQSYQKYFKVV